MVASVADSTGYMEICCVCVLTEVMLVQWKTRECSKDVLLYICLLKQHF